MQNKKIALILNHGLGDLIMTRGLLEAVLNSHSGTIDVYIKGNVEKHFLTYLGYDKQVRIEQFPKTTFKRIMALWKMRRENYDTLYAPHITENLLRHLSLYLTKAKHISARRNIGRIKRNFNNKIILPKPYYYLGFFTKDLNLLSTLNKVVAKGSERFILIAPSASDPIGSKVWPVNRYKQLIDKIKDIAPIKVIGTRADEMILNEFRDSPCQVVFSNSIGETLELIAESMMVIGNCSSILHLSDLVDASKILAIYGPTNPYVTGPSFSDMVVIRKDYKCSPCFGDSFNSGCGENRCITDISIDDVLKGFYRVLNSDFDSKENFSSLRTSRLRRFVE